MPSTIYLARHGETTWNVAGRYQGRLESPLSERGQAQAQALAAAFTTERRAGDLVPEVIISSPLQRCQQTGQPLALSLGLELEIDERIIEIGHGHWEGLLRDEISAQYPEQYRLWRQEPDIVTFEEGESLADVAARWLRFAEDLAHVTAPTLVISHDAVVRVALLALQGKPLSEFWQVSVENAAFAVIEANNGTLTLVEECRTDHLHALRASIAQQAL